jgi:flagellar basal-body rod protein FlgG
MSDLLAIAALAMSDDSARLATISHNLANATTPGFKKEIPVSRPFVEILNAQMAGGAASLVTTLPAATTVVDARAGSLRYTGAPLDVAVDGDGWFELAAPEGSVFTRTGSFQVDARGRLVTASGIPLAGNIMLSTTQPRIDAQGRVFEDDRPVGQLRVVRIENPQLLQKQGDGVFAAPASDIGELTEVRVRQGYLENSNVTTLTEMVGVIDTVRHFEATQKLIQSYDGMLDRAIRTLGEF